MRPAGEADRALIEGMTQFYIYDFSEMEPPGSDELEFSAGKYTGRYYKYYCNGQWA